MTNEVKGYYKVWRRARKHVLWNMKPYDPWHAWEDLFGWAAFSRQERSFQKHIFVLDRGEHITTRAQLARDWGWSWSKVDAFLGKLVELGMIREANREGCALITICNFDTWQGRGSRTGRQKVNRPGDDREMTGNDIRRIRKEEEEGAPAKADAPPTPRPYGLEDVQNLSPAGARFALDSSEATHTQFAPDVRAFLEERAAQPA